MNSSTVNRKRKSRTRRRSRIPSVIIFDVDGVLVDVHQSFHRTVLDTICHYTGRRVSERELHRWKNRPGFNDDWVLTHAWLRALGWRVPFEEVKRKFQKIYWGRSCDGNVAREKWLLPAATMARLRKRAELALFTGRTREELHHTLSRYRVRAYFEKILTVEDVRRPKPDPEGLLRILDGRRPEMCLYLGDNVDDAIAARRAGIAFVGVLPRDSRARRERGQRLKEHGALTILGEVCELEAWLRRKPRFS